MNFNPRPAQSVSPGEILSGELEARGWSQKDLAEITGRPHQAINEIVKGSKQITPETAIELAQAFGMSSEFWLNLESHYRLHEAEKKKRGSNKIVQRSRLFGIVPVRELIKRGWIKATKRVEELEEEVCRFLQINSIDQTPKFAAASFRRAEKRGPKTSGQRAWMARVEHLARQQKVSKFSLPNLNKALQDILDLSEKEANVAHVPEILLSLGIHFVIVRHMPKTYLDGATWMINRNPVIALTLRYDRIDSFWFTLLHEVAHIIRKHGSGVCNLYDTKPADKDEQEANNEAQLWLVDPAELESFVKNTRYYYSKNEIESFATESRRHPGIIVGQMQYAGLMGYNYRRNYLVKVRPYLKEWMDPTFFFNAPTNTV
jgi:HTH-type transcriptional regulator/antitoxin HigA